MPIYYKIDVIQALKDAGYSTYDIQRENLLSSSTMQKLRTGEIVGPKNLAKLCDLLNCQPGDIIGHKKKDEKK